MENKIHDEVYERELLVKEARYLLAKLEKEYKREDLERLKEVNRMLIEFYPRHQLGPLG